MKFISLILTILFLLSVFPVYAITEAKKTPPANVFKLDKKDIDALAKKNPFKPKLPEIKKADPTNYTSQNIEKVTQPIQAKIIEPPKPPSLTISGLVWNSQRPQAIINGQVVNQGDTIAGARIVLIRKTGIDIVFQDTNFTIKP